MSEPGDDEPEGFYDVDPDAADRAAERYGDDWYKQDV